MKFMMSVAAAHRAARIVSAIREFLGGGLSSARLIWGESNSDGFPIRGEASAAPDVPQLLLAPRPFAASQHSGSLGQQFPTSVNRLVGRIEERLGFLA
jgi:hypothetical protein